MLKALRLVTIGNKKDIESHAHQAPKTVRDFLRAVVSQYNGDVDGAIRSLRRQFLALSGIDRAVVAEVLAPMLIMRHEHDAIPELASVIASAGMVASAHALTAVSFADLGFGAQSRAEVAMAEKALDGEKDEFVALRVLQRMARASLIIGDYEEALNSAAAGSLLSEKMNVPRVAAANYSIAYNIHHAVTGQLGEARRFARLWYEFASKCADTSFMQPALIAEYEMAVQFGDRESIQALERRIHALMLPQQYSERFAFAFSYALAAGTSDLRAMRTLLQVLLGSRTLSPGQRSLCTGLVAVADASIIDDASARMNIRKAISFLGRPKKGDAAHESFHRRLARCAIASACVLVGDDVRADRLVAVSELQDDSHIRQVPELVRRLAWDEMAPHLRGIGSVFQTSWSWRVASSPTSDLTSAEMSVLRLLDRGWSAGRIAKETDRSINTIYNHTRAILGKLEAKRTLEAVAIARERGILS